MTKIISKRGRLGGQSQLSREQGDELIKCAGDPLYFIRRYIMVRGTSGNHKLMLQAHHCDYITMIHRSRNTIAMMPRGTGMTTMSLAYILWEAIFTPRHKTVAFGISATFAKDMFDIITHMLTHIPSWLRPTIRSNRKSYLEFDTGAAIMVETLTVNSLRGRTLNRIYLDSFAFAPDHIQRAIYNDICPTMIVGGKILIGSTPNGTQNSFATAWSDSFKPFSTFASFKRTVDDMSFTDMWKQRTRAMIGMHAWRQNYMCEFL